jgi:tetratricopeptide (TPR) repeat protein
MGAPEEAIRLLAPVLNEDSSSQSHRAASRRIARAAREQVGRLPDDPQRRVEYFMRAAEARERDGKDEEAVPLFWAAAGITEAGVEPVLRLGAALERAAKARMEEGESHEAGEVYLAAAHRYAVAAEAEPDRFEVRRGAGECYLRAGYASRAVEHLVRAESLAPDDGESKRVGALLEEARAAARIRLPSG